MSTCIECDSLMFHTGKPGCPSRYCSDCLPKDETVQPTLADNLAAGRIVIKEEKN